jgi:3-deoxy-manno-octulosonate cytidylyltransferase (CMP-KDO synthetase)
VTQNGPVIIIPARYASRRYPGKPMVPLVGAFGQAQSLIERSWRAALAVQGISAVYVATDDDRVADLARSFGAEVVMTSSTCANGTERCADALDRLKITPDIVVNLQGDTPLTPPWFIEALSKAMITDPAIQVATPVLRCTPEIHARFTDDRRNGVVGGTTAVLNAKGDALYFSKEVLPFTGLTYGPNDLVPVFHHVGVYAYTPDALATYGALGICDIEEFEGLEQLRFLNAGLPVRCIEVSAEGREFWELNNPSDVARIEAIMLQEGMA